MDFNCWISLRRNRRSTSLGVTGRESQAMEFPVQVQVLAGAAATSWSLFYDPAGDTGIVPSGCY